MAYGNIKNELGQRWLYWGGQRFMFAAIRASDGQWSDGGKVVRLGVRFHPGNKPEYRHLSLIVGAWCIGICVRVS